MLWMCPSAGNEPAFLLVMSVGSRQKAKLPYFPFWKGWNFMWFTKLGGFTELLPEMQQDIL